MKGRMLGLIASFNKGMSGGGYGPVVTSGQLLSGVESKNSIGITSLAEGITCFFGLISYIALGFAMIDWKLALCIISGAVVSVPLSARSVKVIDPGKLKFFISSVTIVLGLLTLIKTLNTG